MVDNSCPSEEDIDLCVDTVCWVASVREAAKVLQEQIDKDLLALLK